MSRRKSTRHYTFFEQPWNTRQLRSNAPLTDTEAVSTGIAPPHIRSASTSASSLNSRDSVTPATSPEQERSKESRSSIVSPHKRRRQDSSVPDRWSSSSSSLRAHCRTARHQPRSLFLVDLPDEILYRVGEFLVPVISPINPLTGGPSLSHSWNSPCVDVLNLSLTCKKVRFAIDGLENRNVSLPRCINIIKAAKPDRALDITRRSVPDIKDEEVAQESRWQVRTPGYSASIRHVYMNLDGPEPYLDAPNSAGTILAQLHSVAITGHSEEIAVEHSPYKTKKVYSYHLNKFLCSTFDQAKELYISGIDVMGYGNMTYAGKERDTGLHDQNMMSLLELRTLVINASSDSAFSILRWAPYLKSVKLWRDYSSMNSGTLSIADEWWPASLWETVEALELRGFSGIGGRLMLDQWMKLIRTGAKPNNFPLQSLRLYEAFHFSTFVDHLLPCLSTLRNLRTLTFILWRDRKFSPKLLEVLAASLPQLEELGIGLENDELNWWPHAMIDYGKALSTFPNLQVFRWNYTVFQDAPFEFNRTSVYNHAVLLGENCPKLTSIHWFGCAPYLKRELASGSTEGFGENHQRGVWQWSDAPSQNSTGGGSHLITPSNPTLDTKSSHGEFWNVALRT